MNNNAASYDNPFLPFLPPPIITNKDQPIRTWMHYTETPIQNTKGITVFGQSKPSLFYNYSDRIYHTPAYQNGPIFIDCLQTVIKDNNLDTWTSGMTARMLETALTKYHNQQVDLQHIILGCNMFNGHSYMVFGYTTPPASTKSKPNSPTPKHSAKKSKTTNLNKT